MEKLKIAIIGVGNISKHHIASYQANKNCEIYAFCDINEDRLKYMGEQYNVTRLYTDRDQMFAECPEIDAVSVCTWNCAHAECTIAALNAGKHVICEKPMAMNTEEALAMKEPAEKNGKLLMIGFVRRHGSDAKMARQLIEDGELGEVYHVYASFRAYRSIPGIGGDFTRKASAGGGALIDWGVHYIDLILYCCGEPKPITASGEAFCKLGKNIKDYVYTSMWAEETKEEDGVYDVDDSVVGLVRTEGPVISFNGAWAQNIAKRDTFIDFLGDKGGVRLDYCGHFTFFKDDLTEERPEFDIPDMYYREDSDFLDACETGRRNRSHISAILESAKLLDAIYQSAEEKKEISF